MDETDIMDLTHQKARKRPRPISSADESVHASLKRLPMRAAECREPSLMFAVRGEPVPAASLKQNDHSVTSSPTTVMPAQVKRVKKKKKVLGFMVLFFLCVRDICFFFIFVSGSDCDFSHRHFGFCCVCVCVCVCVNCLPVVWCAPLSRYLSAAHALCTRSSLEFEPVSVIFQRVLLSDWDVADTSSPPAHLPLLLLHHHHHHQQQPASLRVWNFCC